MILLFVSNQKNTLSCRPIFARRQCQNLTPRLYRGSADCENRIKELKYDFGLYSFVMLANKLMNVFRQAFIRQKSHQMLSTLHLKVLAMGAHWGSEKEISQRPTLNLAVARKRRPWFEGL